MTYLLDTCVLSELTKQAPNGGVLGFLRNTDEASLRLSVLTLGELEKGVARLPASAKKEALEEWLREIRETYGARILDVTAEVAVELTGRFPTDHRSSRGAGRRPPCSCRSTCIAS